MNKGINLISEICKYFKENAATITALSFTAIFDSACLIWWGLEGWGWVGWKRTKSRLRRKKTSPDAKQWRITKGSLEARPIFHFTERRIEAHICVCFVAYKLYKELERLLRTLGIHLGVNKVLYITKTISTVTVALPDGTQHTRIMLMTEEQRQFQPLLPL